MTKATTSKRNELAAVLVTIGKYMLVLSASYCIVADGKFELNMRRHICLDRHKKGKAFTVVLISSEKHLFGGYSVICIVVET